VVVAIIRHSSPVRPENQNPPEKISLFGAQAEKEAAEAMLRGMAPYPVLKTAQGKEADGGGKSHERRYARVASGK
jgi:hypothetical protein